MRPAKYISRYSYNGANGWLAKYKDNGKPKSKLFSDSKYGGSQKALQKANKFIQFFNYLESQRGKIQPEKNEPDKRIIQESAKNKTGVIGVCKLTRNLKNGIYEYYQATWYEEGKTHSKTYSCKKYGETEAFHLALEKRVQEMKRIHGDKYSIEQQFII